MVEVRKISSHAHPRIWLRSAARAPGAFCGEAAAQSDPRGRLTMAGDALATTFQSLCISHTCILIHTSYHTRYNSILVTRIAQVCTPAHCTITQETRPTRAHSPDPLSYDTWLSTAQTNKETCILYLCIIRYLKDKRLRKIPLPRSRGKLHA